MTTTLAALQATLARELRDGSHNTWATDELTDAINAGIEAVANVAPKEIVQTIGTVAAGVYSYTPAAVNGVPPAFIYRIDIYDSAGNFTGTIPKGTDGPGSGWEFHDGVVYLPQGWLPAAGSTVQAWGYGRFAAALSASSSTTDLPAHLVWVALLHAEAELLSRLVTDRASFSQWQADPANSDTSLMAVNQAAFQKRRRVQEELRSIRRLRKA